MRTLEVAAPSASDGALQALAQSIRRLTFASLVDPTVTEAEYEAELRALIRGFALEARAAPSLAVVTN